MKTIPPPMCLRIFPCAPLPAFGSFFLFCFFAAARLHGQTCNDLSLVSLDEDCAVLVTPDMVLEGAPIDSAFTVQLTTLAGVPLGAVLTAAYLGDTIRATVTDTLTGNSCWGLLVAADYLPPDLVCSNLTLPCALPEISPAYLSATLGLTAANPIVTENCGAYSLTFLDTWFDLGCADPKNRSASVQRVWTAVDANGNQASCTQLLHLHRIHASEVLLPIDTAVNCTNPDIDPKNTGQPYFLAGGIAFPLYTTPGACELHIAYQDQVLLKCPGAYNILRTWTVYDDCLPTGPENPLMHVQAIHVEDNTGPVFQCPKDITVSTDPFQCNRTFDLPDVLLYDACSGIDSIFAKWVIEGQAYTLSGFLADFPGNNYWHPDTLGVLEFAPNLPAGEVIPFTYTATDQCGNTHTCSFRITVTDGVSPFAVCDEITVVPLAGSGESFVFASTFDDGSWDNCADLQFKVRRVEANDCQPNNQFFDQVKFCCSDAGDTIKVILRVYDVQPDTGAISLSANEQHASECEVTVLVVDKLKPVCTPPPPAAITCKIFDSSLQAHGMAHFADNCCLDTTYELTPNYSLFDTMCNRGTITRTFRAFDCNGLSSQCTQRLIVSYEQSYAIKFPDDVIVNDCDTTGTYSPEPQVYGQSCEVVGISYHDVVNSAGLLSCYWIDRYWKVINWCHYNPNLPLIEIPNPNPGDSPLDIQNIPGPMVAPAGYFPPPTLRHINAGDQTPTDFSTFWASTANGYAYRQIIIVRDKEPPKFRGCPMQTGPIEICDHSTNDPNYWNAGYWANPHIPGSNDICEGIAELAATANDACAKGNLTIRYLLYLDLDHDGVQETVINSINPPPPGMVLYGNALTPNFSGGILRAFDQRPVPLEEKYRFTLNYAGFANITGYVRWTTAKEPTKYIAPQLPHGIHRIQWYVNDGCGNNALCEYSFRVRDCRAPELICLNGLSTDMPVDKTTTLFAQDFLWYVNDNCEPASEVRIGLRKSGSGLGFPLQPDGNPQQSARFDCSELGKQSVELWAMDHAGNTNMCETYVIVQDHFSVCSNTTGTVAGIIKTNNNEGLEDAIVELSGGPPIAPAATLLDQTKPDGAFVFPDAPLGADFTITPYKNNDPLNGVSTYDLVLINKHILGLEPLDTPYKIISADVNRSRSVTTFDMIELRKMILGIYTNLPQSTSWIFVDADFIFPNLSNPFQTIFPETRHVSGLTHNILQENFVAIKVGDVSGNAVANNLLLADDRTTGLALFEVLFAEGMVLSGHEFDVVFQAAETLAGFQFTLAHPGLEVVHLEPGAGMSAENFAVFHDTESITTSWNGTGKPEFVVRFRAATTGNLDQMLRLSSRITRAEAYSVAEGNTHPERKSVALRFGGSSAVEAVGQGFELYPNEPNPWHDHTRIRFYLPEANTVTLTVFDPIGQRIFSKTDACSAGFQSILLEGAAVLAAPGAVYYRLETPTNSASGKMIRW